MILKLMIFNAYDLIFMIFNTVVVVVMVRMLKYPP